MTGRRGDSRGLPPEDTALWDAVKKSIEPLRKPRSAKKRVETETPQPAPKPKTASVPLKSPVLPGEKAAPAAPRPPPLANLDRRTRARVARGRIEIDARLDLHGLTLERARARLGGFLAQAQASGHALVLVITGKGASGRGALRHEVPHWLSSPALRPLVIGFEQASPHHGGAGALYVRVRRVRA